MNELSDNVCKIIKSKIKSGSTAKSLADVLGISADQIRYMLKKKYNTSVNELRITLLTSTECSIIKDRLTKGASARSISEEFSIPLNHLNINLLREYSITTAKIKAAFMKELDIEAAKARKDILKNGAKSIVSYLEEHPTLLVNSTFRQRLNLSSDQIFNVKRKHSKEGIRNRYKELLIEYNGQLTTTKAQEVDPTLVSLIYYHFGNIRNFKATL